MRKISQEFFLDEKNFSGSDFFIQRLEKSSENAINKIEKDLERIEPYVFEQVKEKADILFEILLDINSLECKANKAEKDIGKAGKCFKELSEKINEYNQVLNMIEKHKKHSFLQPVLDLVCCYNEQAKEVRILINRRRYIDAFNILKASKDKMKNGKFDDIDIIENKRIELKELMETTRDLMVRVYLGELDNVKFEKALDYTIVLAKSRLLGLVLIGIEEKTKTSIKNILIDANDEKKEQGIWTCPRIYDFLNNTLMIFNEAKDRKKYFENILIIFETASEKKYLRMFIKSLTKKILNLIKYWERKTTPMTDSLKQNFVQIDCDFYKEIMAVISTLQSLLEETFGYKNLDVFSNIGTSLTKNLSVLLFEREKLNLLNSFEDEKWPKVTFSHYYQEILDNKLYKPRTVMGTEKNFIRLTKLKLASEGKSEYNVLKTMLVLLQSISVFFSIVKFSKSYSLSLLKATIKTLQLFNDEIAQDIIQRRLERKKRKNLSFNHFIFALEILEFVQNLIPLIKACFESHLNNEVLEEQLKNIFEKVEIHKKQVLDQIISISCDLLIPLLDVKKLDDHLKLEVEGKEPELLKEQHSLADFIRKISRLARESLAEEDLKKLLGGILISFRSNLEVKKRKDGRDGVFEKQAPSSGGKSNVFNNAAERIAQNHFNGRDSSSNEAGEAESSAGNLVLSDSSWRKLSQELREFWNSK